MARSTRMGAAFMVQNQNQTENQNPPQRTQKTQRKNAGKIRGGYLHRKVLRVLQRFFPCFSLCVRCALCGGCFCFFNFQIQIPSVLSCSSIPPPMPVSAEWMCP